MKVRNIMSTSVFATTPEAPLSEVTRIMWDNDCGFVPVTDPSTNVVCGVITDRDICMASWSKDRSTSEIPVADVMSKTAHCCHEDDELFQVHTKMRRHQVRRLPVVDSESHPVGIIALNDLALDASDVKEQSEVAKTLRAICQHRSCGVMAIA